MAAETDGLERILPALEDLPEVLVVTDESLKIAFANPQALELLGTEIDQLCGQSIREILAFCEDSTLSQVQGLSAGQIAAFEEILRSSEGVEFRIKARVRCFDHGGQRRFLWIFLDYSEEQQSRQEMIDFMADLSRAKAKIQEYAEQFEVYQRIVDNINQGILGAVPSGDVFFRNKAAERILGWEAGVPAVEGKILEGISHPGDVPVNDLACLEKALVSGPVRGEILVLNREKEQEIRCFVTVFLLEGKGQPLRIWNLIEIKEDLDRQQELIDYSAELTAVNRELQEKNTQVLRLSRMDVMTGVYNRSYILELLENEISEGGREKGPLALMLFDVDDFKAINDRYGHLFGDDVLRRMTALIRETLGSRGYVGRYGGEEFLAVLPGMDSARARETAKEMLEQVNGLDFPFEDPGDRLGLSWGVTVQRPGDTSDDMLSRADMAMYAGKRRGKNCVVSAEEEGL